MFSIRSNERQATPDVERLQPATCDELLQSLAFALRFYGRKRTHRADEAMASIVADHIARYRVQCGYIIMKKPSAPAHRAPDYKPPHQAN
jgi:hypothetical protein